MCSTWCCRGQVSLLPPCRFADWGLHLATHSDSAARRRAASSRREGPHRVGPFP